MLSGEEGIRGAEALSEERVRFSRPVIDEIRKAGLMGLDMHYHTSHSDGAKGIPRVLKRARKMGIGLAVTDHNEVSGVREAYEGEYDDVLVIPGMEVSADDGPHILTYFYEVEDLVDFFKSHVGPYRRKSPYMAIEKDTEYILAAAKQYHCIISAAHPFGYYGFDKGLGKCIDKGYIDESMYGGVDALEVLCSGMPHSLNVKGMKKASDLGKAITGGSDGHLLSDLGRVLTCTEQMDCVEGFLDAVGEGRSVVIGMEKNPLEKAYSGLFIGSQYIEYLWPSLVIHYQQNIGRVTRFFAKKK